MSRLSVNNQHDLMSIICHLTRNAAQSSHRALLTCDSSNSVLLENFIQFHQITCLRADDAADRADKISSVLGTEHRALAIQMGKLPDMGLLVAAAGTLMAGGILFLIIDNDSQNTPSKSAQRFQRLMTDSIACNPAVMRNIDGKKLPSKQTESRDTIQQLQYLNQLMAGKTPNLGAESINANICQQDKQFDEAMSHWQNHEQACVVITGERGRGKSRLLTRIANHLYECGQDFHITSRHRSALTIYDQFKTHTSDQTLSAEQALKTSGQALLIEEAGSFSLAQLHQLLRQYKQIVMCTTLDGYEIAGRAFANRLLPSLSQLRPNFLMLQPTVSWRWAIGDPLEALTNQLLLNERSDVQPDSTELKKSAAASDFSTSNNNIATRLVTQAELAADESLLQAVYGLLRDNHYQSSAKDIQHLLDAADLRITILTDEGKILAAAMVVLEGELDPNLSEAIISKTRRLHHHLLPQLLAQTSNRSDALSQRYARVVRIAVKDGLRRLGLGSSLLAFTEKQLRSPPSNVAAIGASFAGDPANLAFWQSQHYKMFHQGFKANPRTGVTSVALMKAFKPSLEQVLEWAVAIHTDNQQWRDHPTLAREQFSQHPFHEQIRTRDEALLKRFACGQRSLHDSYAAIHRLAMSHKLCIEPEKNQTRKQYEVAMRELVRLLTDNDWATRK